MREIDKKAGELLREFLKTGISKFEIYPEVNLGYYKISISKLSSKQVKNLKDSEYI